MQKRTRTLIISVVLATLGACGGEGSLGADSGLPVDSSAVPPDVDQEFDACIDAISARGSHSCGISDDNRVFCWGRNHRGQLGDGSTADSSMPRLVALPQGVVATAIVTGAAHSCVLAAGDVYCWGYGGDGVVTGSPGLDSSTPKRVAGISGAVQLISGGFHACVISSGGDLSCWGDNIAGQIGAGSIGGDLGPTLVASGVASGAAGEEHTCAVMTSSSEVQCWGRGSEGQLGDGSMIARASPALVVRADASVLTAATVTGGLYHSCAVSAGSVECWGKNGFGQSDGIGGSDLSYPTVVAGISGASTVEAGEHHSCALTQSGAITCWGYNGSGQLGQGDLAVYTNPVTVDGLSAGVTMVATGDLHSCVTSNGVVKCWGYNASGQLGDGTDNQAQSPSTTRFRCQ